MTILLVPVLPSLNVLFCLHWMVRNEEISSLSAFWDYPLGWATPQTLVLCFLWVYFRITPLNLQFELWKNWNLFWLNFLIKKIVMWQVLHKLLSVLWSGYRSWGGGLDGIICKFSTSITVRENRPEDDQLDAKSRCRILGVWKICKKKSA